MLGRFQSEPSARSVPALGSALYGIRMQGDFAGGAHRSHVTAERLERLGRAMREDPVEHPRLLARPLTLPG